MVENNTYFSSIFLKMVSVRLGGGGGEEKVGKREIGRQILNGRK